MRSVEAYLTSVGLPADEETYGRVLDTAVEEGIHHPWTSSPGASYEWRSGNGIGLWVHTPSPEDIICVTPVLLSDQPIQLFVRDVIEDPECVHCSTLTAENRSTSPDGEMLYPLGIQLADYMIVRSKLQCGERRPVFLTALAESFESFADEKDFVERGARLPSGRRYAQESFLPNYVTSEDSGEKRLSPHAMVTGVVQDCVSCEGVLGGPSWNRVRLSTNGMSLECALAKKSSAVLRPAHIVQGRFWLVTIGGPTWKRS